MIKVKLPSYPLITIDPLFSIWSSADTLYNTTKMWTDEAKPINGNIKIDDEYFRFMGAKGADVVIPQTDIQVSLTATQYTFCNQKIKLVVTFTMPVMLDDLAESARPINYIDVEVHSLDGKEHRVEVVMDFNERLTYSVKTKRPIRANILPFPDGKIGYMGKAIQRSLNRANDNVSMDWGWLYVSGQVDIFTSNEGGKRKYFKQAPIKDKHAYFKNLTAIKCGGVSADSPLKYFVTVAYDDLNSINYFGVFKKAFWNTKYYNIIEAIRSANAEHDQLIEKCRAWEAGIEQEVLQHFSKEYLGLLVASYRQTLSAHKIINVDGKPIYISKECGSGGYAGTADVSYPSIPLYLYLQPKLIAGMLEPIFNYARTKSWHFDFAPHDAGIYPFVCGQVYGANPIYVIKHSHLIKRTKFICMQHKAKQIHDLAKQMPTEECGNMLLMACAYYQETDDIKFLQKNSDLLSTWADYLVAQGVVIGAELCTDDFNGITEKNVNLAIKSVVAIGAWGKMLNILQAGEGEEYIQKATDFAKDLERIANNGNHLTATIDNRNSWSLKYNLALDKVLGTNLFSEQTFANEVKLYKSKLCKYGLPLDSDNSRCKSDWAIWASVLDDSGELTEQVSTRICNMLAESESRVPFTDRYDVYTGIAETKIFRHRSVQGAMFLPLYMLKMKKRYTPTPFTAEEQNI